MRLLLSAGVSSFDADASDSGVDERLLLGKLAKLFSGTRVVIDAGGVSSLLPGSDLTGVLEKCSRLDRTSVCCKQEAMTLSLSLSLSLSRSTRLHRLHRLSILLVSPIVLIFICSGCTA
jgi:hypothetical protein